MGFYLFLFVSSFYEEGEEPEPEEVERAPIEKGPAYTEIKGGFIVSSIDDDGAEWENLKYYGIDN